MKKNLLLSKIVPAIVAYAGGLDDPRIGWTGGCTSKPELFRCERCGQEHEDSTLIPHLESCSAKALLVALAYIKDWNEQQ